MPDYSAIYANMVAEFSKPLRQQILESEDGLRDEQMTFKQFMAAVDKRIANIACGMTHSDFADILWYDLYEDVQDPQDDFVFEALAEQDSIFAGFLELSLEP